MSRLDYTINFYKSDLVRDIAQRLGAELPDTSFSKLISIAEKSVDTILTYGNQAVYQGLVEYCLKTTMKEIQNSTTNSKLTDTH